jgi:predicted ThiF/HesA family dinucleotide-utilizing enzyme
VSITQTVTGNVTAGVAEAARATREYLASDAGRRLRRRVATIVVVGAPIVAELPGVRRHPVARLVRTAGVLALLVKGAEWLRDWEPGPEPVMGRIAPA